MKQDEVINMAFQAGKGDDDWIILLKQLFKHFPEEFTQFVALLAAHEREACANVCETLELPKWPDKVRQPLAQAIRARGQA